MHHAPRQFMVGMEHKRMTMTVAEKKRDVAQGSYGDLGETATASIPAELNCLLADVFALYCSR